MCGSSIVSTIKKVLCLVFVLVFVNVGFAFRLFTVV